MRHLRGCWFSPVLWWFVLYPSTEVPLYLNADSNLVYTGHPPVTKLVKIYLSQAFLEMSDGTTLSQSAQFVPWLQPGQFSLGHTELELLN